MNYARPLSPGEPPARARLSRLAVASIVLAAVACPCLDNTWQDLVTSVARREIPSAWFAFAPPSLSLIIAFLAVLRIKRSRGRRRGMEWAAFALMLASIWLTFMIVISILI